LLAAVLLASGFLVVLVLSLESGDGEPPVAGARSQVQLSVEVRGDGRILVEATVEVARESEDGKVGEPEQVPPAKDGLLSCALEPGSYHVRARCVGYSGVEKSVKLVKGEPQNVVLELQRGTEISGRILNRDGRPVAGARVIAMRDFAGPEADLETIFAGFVALEQTFEEKYVAEARTAEDGSYRLTGLDTWWYTVRAVATSYSFGEKEGVPAPSNDVDLLLDPGGTLQGLVRSSSGEVVPGARVAAYFAPENAGLFTEIIRKARPPVEENKSDAGGRYRLGSLGPGLYNFLVEAPGYQETKAMKVRVVAGTNPDKVFTLEPGGIIRGFVRGPSDEPIAGAKVRATPIGLKAPPGEEIRIRFDDGSQTTDEQGYFKFDTLAKTHHRLLVWHDDYQSQQRKDVETLDEDIVIKLLSGSRISGTVVDSASGQPIPGATVSVTDLANIRKAGVTDEAGLYRVRGLGAKGRPVSISVKADAYARAKRQVTVKEDQESVENFELQPAGSVAGRVVDSEGNALVGALVEVRRAQENAGTEQVVGHGTSDRDGRFDIQGVEPGEGARARARLTSFLEAFSEPFDVAPGESTAIPDIAMKLGGTIEGKVVDAQGAPISSAWITAREEGGTDLVNTTVGNAKSAADGRFALRGLPGGAYDLEVKAGSYLAKLQPGVQVIERKATAGIEIVLEAGGFLAGQVLDSNGAPVSAAEVSVREYTEGFKELRPEITDAEGRFRVQNLSSKDFVKLEVHHDDYGAYSSSKVAVGDENLEVVLRPLGMIRGVLVDPEGKPLSSFSVQAESPDGAGKAKRLNAKTFSPTDGSFEYRGLPDGTYTVSVRAPSFSVVTVADIRVAAGQATDVGQIQLLEGGRISGTVVASEGGAPVAGATVRVTQGFRAFRDPGARVAEVTGPDGSFTFEKLKDGAVTLEVSHADFVKKRVTGVDTKIAEKSRNLMVALDRGGEISGSVAGRGGKALKGITSI
jgi:uncharacterized GH25 family protein